MHPRERTRSPGFFFASLWIFCASATNIADVDHAASSLEVAEHERDVVLLMRVRGGDEGAFNTLVNVYAVALYRFAYVRTRDRTMAEDVVQDVFAYLWERREEIEIQTRLRSYLYRAVANRAMMILRHTRSQERVEQIVYADLELEQRSVVNDGAAAIDVEEMDHMVREALAKLPPRTREIFMLNREQGISYAEIAEILDIGLPTIRNQVSRATQAILFALQRWRAEG